MYDEKELRLYDRMGIPRPSSEPHGTAEEIRSNLKPAKVSRWTLEGNKLVAETDFGPVINYLPTDYILRGVDENGLPILEKLVL